MGSCNSIPGRYVDFSKVTFDSLDFKLEGGTLKFESGEGKFIETDNVNFGQSQKQPQNQHLNEDLERARKDVNDKKERIKSLKTSIKELEVKHAQLMKILNIDFNEKEYIDKLIIKYEENKEKESIITQEEMSQSQLSEFNH